MTATFNASNSPIANIVLSQVMKAKADVSAADAGSAGYYAVFFVVQKQNADGSWTFVTEYSPATLNLTQAPTSFAFTYTPPSEGTYQVYISVRNPQTWGWLPVVQNTVTFSVGPIPVVNGIKYYVPISPPPDEVGVVPLIKQFDGSYLPSAFNWQMIPGMSVVDNSVLDLTKWRRKFWSFYGDHADHLNDELQRYVDSGVAYNNGVLQLTATPRPNTQGHAPSSTGIQYPLFDSGMVRSVTSARFFFAHLQLVIPKALGIWPAWWIIPADGRIDPNPEMDMLEFVYNGQNETANMIHCNCSGNKALLWHDASYNVQFGYLKPNPTFYDADYFVNRVVDICFLWSEDSTMTLYHDGNPTAKWYFPWFYQGGVAVPATVMINLAIGGSWPTNGFTTPVPTAPVTVNFNFLKTYSKIATVYGPPSPV
ncbi:family 16 glycosylhydrolase [Bradyrhizobium lablabi]|uniref:glycoside hydrolase family 16 protein n=1 Tax=Bradyrhizobium lablabi TaxID=722472 RepID=UPI001BAC49AF|nr:family 16 glycosylhydrolase [Bradyrhizobium lablabi]MBR0693649.1 family 16 glycosylhydrolase [Bradyrhizobium lablabi]